MMTKKRAVKIPDWAGKLIEEEMDGCPVIKGFESPIKDAGFFLADLGHRPMAMVHGDDVVSLGTCGPGKVVETKTGLAGILSPGEAVVFDFTGPVVPEWPEGNYTDISDGYVMFGLWGSKALDLLQRLIPVDVERPDINEPVFLGAGSHGVFTYVINLKKKIPGFILACARSDVQSYFDNIVHAGKPLGLKIEGIDAFMQFWKL